MRNYIKTLSLSLNFSKEDLTWRPVTWTIGPLSPAGAFFESVKIARRSNIDIGLLPSGTSPRLAYQRSWRITFETLRNTLVVSMLHFHLIYRSHQPKDLQGIWTMGGKVLKDR